MSDIKEFSPLWEKWEIVGEIGSGLYGTVYKIRCEENGKSVYGAVKRVELSEPDSQDEIEEMFEGSVSAEKAPDNKQEDREPSPMEEKLNAYLDEIETNYSFARSKNLLIYEEHTVFEKSGKSGYDIFIRMPYYESLAEILKNGGLSANDKKKLGVDICSALSDLERRGIFHGDIKPENIFRNDKGDFLLADFGIAKRTDNIVNKRAVKQTVAFMAPELQENKAQKNTADIYSLGLLLYKLFNENREPFINPDSTAEGRNEAILKRIKGVPFPAPCQADKELAKVILIACQFSPEARWKNASAFKSALLSAEKGVRAANAAAAAGLAYESKNDDKEDNSKKTADNGTKMTEAVPDDPLTKDDLAALEEAPDSENAIEESETEENGATRVFDLPKAEPLAEETPIESFAEPEFEFAEDEPEKKGKGKIALIIIAILIVLAALGGVIYYAISTGMFGSNTSTPDTAQTTTGDATEITKPSLQSKAAVSSATAKPTEEQTEAVQYVSVPNIVGMDYSQALDEISYAGLSVSIDSYVYSDSYAENTIIEVSPSEGETVESGDTVSIVISRGPKPDENTTGPSAVSSSASSSSASATEKKTGGYVLEGSDSRYIDKSEIYSMDERTLTLALNEIYARHGRIFQTEYIAEYFNSKSWYEPKYTATEYDGKVTHNEFENKNINTIVSVMTEKGYR